jgi:hypothetical protein
MRRACALNDFRRFRYATKLAASISMNFVHTNARIFDRRAARALKARGATARDVNTKHAWLLLNRRLARGRKGRTRLEFESLLVCRTRRLLGGKPAHQRIARAARPRSAWHSHCNKQVTTKALLPVTRVKERSRPAPTKTSWTRPGSANASYETAAGPLKNGRQTTRDQ